MTHLFTAPVIRNVLIAASLVTIAASPAFAEKAPSNVTSVAMVETVATDSAPLQRRNKTLKGDVSVITVGDKTVLRFSDDFRASNGPDLKIFLSPKAVGDVTGKTATQGAVLVSTLDTNRGAFDVVLPAGVDINAFESVLIHCEAFSVLWGGADI